MYLYLARRAKNFTSSLTLAFRGANLAGTNGVNWITMSSSLKRIPYYNGSTNRKKSLCQLPNYVVTCQSSAVVVQYAPAPVRTIAIYS